MELSIQATASQVVRSTPQCPQKAKTKHSVAIAREASVTFPVRQVIDRASAEFGSALWSRSRTTTPVRPPEPLLRVTSRTSTFRPVIHGQERFVTERRARGGHISDKAPSLCRTTQLRGRQGRSLARRSHTRTRPALCGLRPCLRFRASSPNSLSAFHGCHSVAQSGALVNENSSANRAGTTVQYRATDETPDGEFRNCIGRCNAAS